MAIPFPSPSPISICLPVRPDTGGPQAWAVQYYYNVLVLGGPDRMRLGAHGPGAWSKSWRFFYFFIFYFHFLQKYIFVFNIYKNIPRPPSCRAAGTWSLRCRAAGAYL